ncbi:MAG: helicase-related protein [Pirellulaceae bacterium]
MISWLEKPIGKSVATSARIYSRSLLRASDNQLRRQVVLLRDSLSRQKRRIFNRVQLDTACGLLIESFRRVLNIDLYDVQLEAGVALTLGRIAEVQTGEGKTFITAVPAFLFSLHGRGVHVATTNEYLCQRDYELLRPVYRTLGVTVGCLKTDASEQAKRGAYACDITYGPGYEFGFNYLRDQIRLRSEYEKRLGSDYLDRIQGRPPLQFAPVQPKRAFAIIDEADSVLIDEANTPLVLSGASAANPANVRALRAANSLALNMVKDVDFQVDRRRIKLLELGEQQAKVQLAAEDMGVLTRPWRVYILNALQAHYSFARDVDYVVQNATVTIVDQYTGRIHDERKWQNGLHQAVEVIEGLAPSLENIVEARITRQRFLQLYDMVCGLTGTASGNEADFRTFYGLSVQPFATHRPCLRRVLPARYFSRREFKAAHVVQEAIDVALASRSVLIGTRSIAEANHYATLFAAKQRSVNVLHGIQARDEAEIVAEAGQPGRITITTNLAGRGTDIQLADVVRRSGGLHVIATEYNDSARIDRQLAGRTARQGDAGSARWFASADDTIFTDHADRLVLAKRMRDSLRQIASEDGITSNRIDQQFRLLQQQLERIGFERRSRMVADDRWMESIQKVVA